MWRNLKFLHMWSDLKFLHMKDVEKSEISPIVYTIYGILLHFTQFCYFRCFVAKFYLAIYTLLCGENLSQK